MIDVLATTQDGTRTARIQVKTRSAHNRQGWIFGKDLEQAVTQTTFYVALVDLLQLDQQPDYYLIPKNSLARWISEDYRKFRDRGGRDNPIRALPKSQLHVFENYHNNWELLGA